MILGLVILAIMLGVPMPADAATIMVGPSNCSAAVVNSAIASAADGDTIQLNCTGTVTWNATVTIPASKGLTLMGGGNNTPKTSANFPLTISSSADPIIEITCENNRALNRVTGFRFRNTVASNNGAVFVKGRGTGRTGLGCFRIDNNYFDAIQMPNADLQGTVTIWSSTGVMTGLIDSNTLRDSSWTDGYVVSIQEPWKYGGTQWANAGQNAWTRPFVFGNNDFIFIEDNLFENNSRYTRHQIEAIQGGKYVARYNVFDVNRDNGGIQTEAVEAHGFCFCQSIGHGTRGGEIYSNTFKGTEHSNTIYLRGGTWLVYDNVWLNAPSGDFIQLKEYRASSSCDQCDNSCPSDPTWANCVNSAGAYPMAEQIAGTYVWNNLYQGVSRVPAVNPTGVQRLYIQAGRDYFVSAAKPGALSSYTPYTYPHPLRNIGVTPPNPPQNLSIQ
jgi:hypothetical protein